MTRQLTFCSADENDVELATEMEETEEVLPDVCVFSHSLGPRCYKTCEISWRRRWGLW